MLFLTCVLCHSVRQAPRIVYDEVRAYVMSLAVLCGEHRVCLNTLQLCQRIQSRTEVELEKTYCRIPIAISSIWDIPDSYHPGHLWQSLSVLSLTRQIHFAWLPQEGPKGKVSTQITRLEKEETPHHSRPISFFHLSILFFHHYQQDEA